MWLNIEQRSCMTGESTTWIQRHSISGQTFSARLEISKWTESSNHQGKCNKENEIGSPCARISPVLLRMQGALPDTEDLCVRLICTLPTH